MNSRQRRHRTLYNRWRVLVACGLCLLFIACATVPLTERKSLRLIPESELASLSDQQYTKVLRESTLSKDQTKVQMVRRVGARIASAAEGFLKLKGRNLPNLW